MKIDAFAKKFGQSKRNVDYWTNCGLLHPEVNESNKYRDYTEKSEEEMKKIIAVQSAGLKLDQQSMMLIDMAKSDKAIRKMLSEAIKKRRDDAIKNYDLALSLIE